MLNKNKNLMNGQQFLNKKERQIKTHNRNRKIIKLNIKWK